MTDELVTVKEAAYLARVSRRTIERWIQAGQVRAVRAQPGARWVLVPRVDVDPHGKIPPPRKK